MSLALAFTASIGLRCSVALLSLLVNVMLARTLGVAEFGIYMTLVSAGLLLGALAVRGADQVLTRELAGNHPDHEASQYRKAAIRWSRKRVAMGSAAAVACYLAWVIAGEQGLLLSQLCAGGLMTALLATNTLQAGALNGLGSSLKSQALPAVQSCVILAVMACLLGFNQSPHRATQALWLQAGAYVVTVAVGAAWIRGLQQRAPAGPRQAEGMSSVSEAQARGWARAARGFMLVTFSSVLVNRFDVVLVSALTTDEVAGLYAAGARLAQVALMVALAVNVVLGPRIAMAWAQHNSAGVRRLLYLGLAFTVPVSVLEVLVATGFSKTLVSVFGGEYAAAAAPFAWVILAYALWTVAAPCYSLLAMTGGEQVVAAISWAVLAANMGSMLWLVPHYGASGAGMAMTLGYALPLPFAFAAALRRLRHRESADARS